MVWMSRLVLIICLLTSPAFSAKEPVTYAHEDDRLLPFILSFKPNRRQKITRMPRTPEALLERQLVVATRNGQLTTMQRLLAAGVNANVPHCPKATLPLISACSMNRVDMVELLLSHCASTDATDREENTPLAVACWHKLTAIGIIEALLDHGASVDVMNHRNKTPIADACDNRRADIVQCIIAHCHKLKFEPYMDNETRAAVEVLAPGITSFSSPDSTS